MSYKWLSGILFSFKEMISSKIDLEWIQNLPNWVGYVVLAVIFIALVAFVLFMFKNSRASAFINFGLMILNVFLMFYSIEEKGFVNPRAIQDLSQSDFSNQYAASVWGWEIGFFIMASLSVTANVHTFFTDDLYNQYYIYRDGHVGYETKGVSAGAKTWIAFGVILAVSLGVVALGLYKNMWWLQAYSLLWVIVSIIQIVVTCKWHHDLDL